jgi:hypothetical protein
MVNELTTGVSEDQRSVLRRLQDLLPQIEKGLAEGYSHAVMHAQLPKLGIDISLGYYHRVLHKLRKEEREGKQKRSSEPIAATDRLSGPSVQVEPSCTAKAANLQGAIADQSGDFGGTITVKPPKPKSFGWTGEEALTRDFSKF